MTFAGKVGWWDMERCVVLLVTKKMHIKKSQGNHSQTDTSENVYEQNQSILPKARELDPHISSETQQNRATWSSL